MEINLDEIVSNAKQLDGEAWEYGSFGANGVLVVPVEGTKHDPVCHVGEDDTFPWDKTEESRRTHLRAEYIAQTSPMAMIKIAGHIQALEQRIKEYEALVDMDGGEAIEELIELVSKGMPKMK